MPISHQPIEKKQEMFFLITEPLYSFTDVIISDDVKNEIYNALAMEEYKEKIYNEWNLGSVLKQKRSMSVNIYGPSGTGKTMLAHAIASHLKKRIIIVDYAEIESKYVGETSKNITNLFNYAKENDVVLVFDEADALLSKRVTVMNNATDVSVNQTRNVLLKLLDSYDLPLIFTTNFVQNYDKAFFRRISHHINLGYPTCEARKRIWKHYLVNQLPIEGEYNLLIDKLSLVEDITGADIANVILKVAVGCARGDVEKITYEYIIKKINDLLAFKEKTSEYTVETKKITKEEAETILRRDISNG